MLSHYVACKPIGKQRKSNFWLQRHTETSLELRYTGMWLLHNLQITNHGYWCTEPGIRMVETNLTFETSGDTLVWGVHHLARECPAAMATRSLEHLPCSPVRADPHVAKNEIVSAILCD